MIQFSTDDLRTPQSLELVLRQFQSALQTQVTAPKLPSLSDLARQLAPLIRDQLQAPGAFPLNLQSLLPSAGGTAVDIEGLHASRIIAPYTPPITLGATFFETDRTVTYVTVLSSGSLVWRYKSGSYVSGFADRPADLGTNDSGFLFYATDQDTIYIWTGAAYDTISRRILLGGFFAIFTHANTANRTYVFADADGNIVFETSTLTANNLILGAGTAKITPLGSLGTTTTVLHGNAGGAPSFAAVVLTTDVSGILPAANGGTGIAYDRLADTIARTGQNADISATPFAGTVAPGTYRVSYSLLDTTADVTAGAVTLTIAWTDGAGAATSSSSPVALTGLGTLRASGVFYLQLASGNVTYAITHTGVFGTATYALYIAFERLS